MQTYGETANFHDIAARRALFSGQVRPVSDVFDISVREPGTSTVFGQTARSMMKNYTLAREFGMTRTQVASFSFGDRYTVQDQFVEELTKTGDDLSGCYVSLTIDNHVPALDKINRYAVPNIFIDFFIGDDLGVVDLDCARRHAALLLAVIEKTRSTFAAPSLSRSGRPRGEIFVNFGDFVEQRQHWSTFFYPLFEDVRRASVQGICFEEFRGAGLPEDIWEAAGHLRRFFPFNRFKVLAHVHGGNGLEDACNLAAVAGGADGIWASLSPTSALSGHGSSIVFLTNLYRYGNKDVLEQYNLHLSHRIVRELYSADFAGQESAPRELALFGKNAYSVNFSAFSQETTLPAMLPARVVGVQPTARFVPLLYDRPSIAARLAELGVRDIDDALIERLLDKVHRHLLDDLHADRDTRVDFNSSEYLRSALGLPAEASRPSSPAQARSRSGR